LIGCIDGTVGWCRWDLTHIPLTSISLGET